MTAKLSQDGVCSTRRLLPFSPDEVFDAFANPDWLTAWWGPDGFRNTVEVFEFQPQGQWHFVTDGPDGQQSTTENTFVETSPPRVVIRSGTLPPSTVTVNLAEAGEHTELQWHQAFDDARAAASQADRLSAAAEQELDRLQAVLTVALGR